MNTVPTSRSITHLSLAIVVIATSVFNQAHALEYECTAGTDQRFIRLELPGEEHLCEVSVTLKDGLREVKWYANSESAFCTTKTNELKGKYEQLWGFTCSKWPDTDGIDALSKRHRVILDTELKKQIALGKESDPAFTVKAVKAIASSENPDMPSMLAMLAMQFFNSRDATPPGMPLEDVTLIIHDNGDSWFTQSRVSTLTSYIPNAAEHKINSALISTIDSSGTLEISTMVSDNNTNRDCYGAQTFLSNVDGTLIPRTPHRFVCQ